MSKIFKVTNVKSVVKSSLWKCCKIVNVKVFQSDKCQKCCHVIALEVLQKSRCQSVSKSRVGRARELRSRRPAPRNFSGFSPQVLSVASWCHPSLPLFSPPSVFATLASHRRVIRASVLMSSVPPLSSLQFSRWYSHLVVASSGPCGLQGLVASCVASCVASPRRRRRCSSPHRRVSTSSSPRRRILTHLLPGSSEARERGSEACGNLGCEGGTWPP